MKWVMLWGWAMMATSATQPPWQELLISVTAVARTETQLIHASTTREMASGLR